MTDAPATTPRAAASLILLRDVESGRPRVLAGRRPSSARFMPNMHVFPGGMVDSEDAAAAALLAPGDSLASLCAERLVVDPRGAPGGEALALAAIRETFEETGVRIGVSETVTAPETTGASWSAFAASGVRPRIEGMTFVLRAITPPQMKIRFDARIFVVDADEYAIDIDDFSGASGELEDLGWVDFAEAVTMTMPFPTALAFAEVMAGAHLDVERPVPFVDQSEHRSVIVGL